MTTGSESGEEYVDMKVAKKVEQLLDRVERDGMCMGFVEYGVLLEIRSKQEAHERS